jgi:transposase
MSLRTIHISEADADAARYEMYSHVDLIVQKRMHCLWLKSLGYKNQEIQRILHCSRNTIGTYLGLYESGGLEGLRTLNYNQPTSKLDRPKHVAKVEASFLETPPRSVKEARERIKKMTGITRSISRTRSFLHRLGMKPRLTGQIPAKADPGKQRAFHDEVLQPLLAKANNGECHVLFMDGAHFVLSAFTAVVWCFSRVFTKTAPGRFRLNVLGAVDAITKELTAVYNTTYVNANTVVELLEDIAEKYGTGKGKSKKKLPIYIFLDNARYQHCQFVKDAAERLGITLQFLPAYSPNLNLIERLWKYIRQEVLASNYFADAESFKNAIINFLNQMHKKKVKKELNSRLSLNFQLF